MFTFKDFSSFLIFYFFLRPSHVTGECLNRNIFPDKVEISTNPDVGKSLPITFSSSGTVELLFVNKAETVDFLNLTLENVDQVKVACDFEIDSTSFIGVEGEHTYNPASSWCNNLLVTITGKDTSKPVVVHAIKLFVCIGYPHAVGHCPNEEIFPENVTILTIPEVGSNLPFSFTSFGNVSLKFGRNETVDFLNLTLENVNQVTVLCEPHGNLMTVDGVDGEYSYEPVVKECDGIAISLTSFVESKPVILTAIEYYTCLAPPSTTNEITSTASNAITTPPEVATTTTTTTTTTTSPADSSTTSTTSTTMRNLPSGVPILKYNYIITVFIITITILSPNVN